MARVTKEQAEGDGDVICEYRGKDVTATTAIVRKAGDGLSATLNLKPVIYESGDLVTLVIRAKVSDHTFKWDDESGTYCLVQNFDAGAMVVLDSSHDKAMGKLLDENEAAIQRKKDAGRGTPSLPGTNTGSTGEAEDSAAA